MYEGISNRKERIGSEKREKGGLEEKIRDETIIKRTGEREARLGTCKTRGYSTNFMCLGAAPEGGDGRGDPLAPRKGRSRRRIGVFARLTQQRRDLGLLQPDVARRLRHDMADRLRVRDGGGGEQKRGEAGANAGGMAHRHRNAGADPMFPASRTQKGALARTGAPLS